MSLLDADDTEFFDDAEDARTDDGFRDLTLNLFVDGAGDKSTRSCAVFFNIELVSRDLVTFLSGDEDFSEFLLSAEPVGLRILRFSTCLIMNFVLLKSTLFKASCVTHKSPIVKLLNAIRTCETELNN